MNDDMTNEDLATALKLAADQKDWATFEQLVIKANQKTFKETITDNGGVYQKPSVETPYVPILCQVLDERHDINNEEIVDALDLPADPRAVPTLARVLHDYPIWPEWDDMGGLAVKAIWALERIGTPEAIKTLQQASTSQQLLAASGNISVKAALQKVLDRL